jgi:hypothetical protein
MRNDNRRELTPRELHRQRRKEQIQRRRLVAGLILLGLIIIIIVLVATCNGGGGTSTTTTKSSGSTSTTLGAATYTADLSGDNSVPAVDTTATGTLTLTYDPVSEELSYTLKVTGLESPTSAAIYQGAEGDQGTAVYTLLASPAEAGEFSGNLARGIIDEANLTGPMANKTLGDLIGLIVQGNAYVSVGTAAHPVDGIRGQISLSAEDTTTSAGDSSDTTDTTGDTSDTTSTTA